MGTKTVSELVGLLKDKDRDVRASAVKELSESMEQDAVPALIEALTDQEALVRKSAADALNQMSLFRFVIEEEWS